MRAVATGGRRLILALALYTVLALILTWPLAAHFTTHVAGDGIDDPALAWNLWWVKLRLVDQLNPNLFQVGWMFHPIDINLAFYTLTPLNGLASIPLQLAFGLTTAVNVLLLGSFVLSGLGAYLLMRQMFLLWDTNAEQGASQGASQERDPQAAQAVLLAGLLSALFAGVVYALAAPKLFYAALGQFNIASSQWIPFCALYLVRLAAAQTLRLKLRAALWAGLFLVFQAYAELTYASFLLIFSACLLLWMLVFGKDWRERLHNVGSLALVGVVFVLGLLPFLAAMLPDMAAEGDFFGRGGGFADVFSADLLGYLLPTRLHPLFGSFVAALPFPNDKGQQVFGGYVVLLLAAGGAWALWRGGRLGSPLAASGRRWLFFWLPVTLLFWLLTLGPQVRLNGQALPLPGPFALVSQLPFFSGNRYPSRYSVMLLLGLAVLAGAGLFWLLTRRRVVMRQGRGAAGWGAAGWAAVGVWVIVLGLFVFEHLSIPLPLSDQRIPPLYAALAADVRAAAIANPQSTPALLELPTGWRNGARVLGKSDLLIMGQQFYQTEHGLRRLGGNTSRNPEFKFQYFTDAPLLGDLIALFNAGEPHLAGEIDAQLDALIARNRPIAAQVLDFLGVEYVTVQVEKSPPQLLRFVDAVLPLTLMDEQATAASDGGVQTIRLYRVDSASAAGELEQTQHSQRIEMGGELANLYLGEGWSPPAVGMEGSNLRYATRAQPLLLANVPSAGGRVVLEWGSPLETLGASVNGVAVAATALDSRGLRWALDVPAQVADRPVDRVLLRLGAATVPAGEVLPPSNTAGGVRPVGETGASLDGGVSLLVRSAGQEVGDFAHIWLNGVDVAGGERGYNLAAIDMEGRLLSAETFDTLGSANAS
jgi:hypothetical protein